MKISVNQTPQQQTNNRSFICSRYALDDMPGHFEIRKYLLIHKAEVKDMFITEYNDEKEEELHQLALKREKEKAEKAERLLEAVCREHGIDLDAVKRKYSQK